MSGTLLTLLRRLPALRAVLGCAVLGCEPQHSTAAGPASAASGVDQVGPVVQPRSGQPTVAGREFTSVTAIFDVLPATVRPGPAGNWTKLRIDAANDVLAREVLGHPARIEAPVRAVGLAPGTINPRYKGLPRARLGQPAIGEVPVTLYAYFPVGSKEQVAAINPGDRLAAGGTISRAQLTEEPNGHGVRLNVDLMDCHADLGKRSEGQGAPG